MLLSEPHPAGKRRIEMSVSVARAMVKREGDERGKRSWSEIPSVCLRLALSSVLRPPTPSVSCNYHTHF